MGPWNIRQLLAAVVWISVVTNPTIANNPAKVENKCPRNCTCLDYRSFSNTVSCREMIDAEFSGRYFEHFLLLKLGSVRLGPNFFNVPSLDHVKSIGISQLLQKYSSNSSQPFSDTLSTEYIYTGKLDIHPNIFKKKSELESLGIMNFEFFVDNTAITDGYLFDAPSIETFHFAVLNYKPWTSSTFIKMSNLTKIYLTSPKFMMDPSVFVPLRRLKNLKIKNAYSWNYVGPNDFITIQTLEELTIGNEIETIHEDAFAHLSQLKHLDISNNKISSFTEKHLRNNSKLEVIRMSNNYNLKILPVFKLDNADNNYYNIRRFECEKCGLEFITDGTFDAMPSLEKLILRLNRLKTLPRGFFKPLKLLQSLDLSSNMISNIPANMLEGATELLDLDLSRNNITTLDLTPFLATLKLQKLMLDQCNIHTWNTTSIPHHSLTSLSIESNKLEYISAKHLQTVPNISELKFFHNPIECYKLEGIIEWALSHNVTTEVRDLGIIYCSSQEGTSCWAELKKFMCSPNYMSGVINQETMIDSDSSHDDEEEEIVRDASAINQSISTLIIILATIAVNININSQILFT